MWCNEVLGNTIPKLELVRVAYCGLIWLENVHVKIHTQKKTNKQIAKFSRTSLIPVHWLLDTSE